MTQITMAKFNELLDINESYKAPAKLMEILYDRPKREQLMRDFLEATNYEVDVDTFQHYFEEEHADRAGKKQDFTPSSVARLTARLVGGGGNSFYEGCAGTGGMLIAAWHNDRIKHSPFDYKPSWYLYTVEELSDRAFPFLLFNIALRGMNAVVVHCDVLSRKAYGAFFVQNDYNDHMQFSSINRLPYNETVECELSVKFVEERYDDLLETPGIPEHIIHGLTNGPDAMEPSELTQFIYKLCGVEAK